MGNDSRRKFIKGIAGTALAASVPQMIRASGIERKEELKLRDYYSANDNIQVALIGAGGMGTADAQTAKTVPGVKIVAACDLFDPRLEEAKKNFGADIFTTRDYKEY
jgi:predicted homoserine dehydrogenase-like protein